MRYLACILAFAFYSCDYPNQELDEKRIIEGQIGTLTWSIAEIRIKMKGGVAQCENYTKIIPGGKKLSIYGTTISESVAVLHGVHEYQITVEEGGVVPEKFLAIEIVSKGDDAISDESKAIISDTLLQHYNLEIDYRMSEVMGYEMRADKSLISEYSGTEGKSILYSDGIISSEAGLLTTLANELQTYLKLPFRCQKSCKDLCVPFEVSVKSLEEAVNDLKAIGIELKPVSQIERTLHLRSNNSNVSPVYNMEP